MIDNQVYQWKEGVFDADGSPVAEVVKCCAAIPVHSIVIGSKQSYLITGFFF